MADYTRINWTETVPITATNLNQMDAGIKDAHDKADTHAERTDDPHSVTKAQVGLGDVLNKEQLGASEQAADSAQLEGNTLAQVREGVTADNVGLDNVENYGIATTAEAEAGTANDKYMTPLRVDEQIANTVDATYVGLGNVDNYSTASTAEAETATADNKFMTPQKTKALIDYHVDASFVGLGSVENYGIATTAEAEEGTADDKYMTPQKTKEAIAELAGSNVTASDVGLGSVENYGIATTTEAEAGTANDKYMTPLRVDEQIAATVDASYVGLGSVENYGIATNSEAEAGTSNTKYMTPLRTAEAIAAQAADHVDKADVGLGNVTNDQQATKTEFDNHTDDGTIHFAKSDVSKSDVGLGNVPNWNGSTNSSLGSSDSTIPSQKAVKTYVDDGLSDKTDYPYETAQVGSRSDTTAYPYSFYYGGGSYNVNFSATNFSTGSFVIISAVSDDLTLKTTGSHSYFRWNDNGAQSATSFTVQKYSTVLITNESTNFYILGVL